MAGRPSKYNPKIADEILRRFASGEKLTAICKPDSMPSRISVFNWKSAYPEFRTAYDIATESHTESLLDTLHGLVMACDDKSARSTKVKADYIMWFCAKLNRKTYGDRIELDIKQTLDISPLLKLAIDRMSAVALPEPLKEAEITE